MRGEGVGAEGRKWGAEGGRDCAAGGKCICPVGRVCTYGRVCTGAPLSLATGRAVFKFVPFALVFVRGGEDHLKPLFVGVLGGGRTVADLGVAGGVEVGC